MGVMPDTLSPVERSKRMSLVRNKGTKPERIVRQLVFSLGYRYRLNQTNLPGKPDLVFRLRHKVIFVHGCFWHRHPSSECKLARLPKSRLDFWAPKLEGNRERDIRNQALLESSGWRYLVIWECELRDTERLKGRINEFLKEDKS